MFQIIQPVFKISKSLVIDVFQNKLTEELLETVQDIINNFNDYFPKLTAPEEIERREPSVFKHHLSLNQDNLTAVLVYLK